MPTPPTSLANVHVTAGRRAFTEVLAPPVTQPLTVSEEISGLLGAYAPTLGETTVGQIAEKTLGELPVASGDENENENETSSVDVVVDCVELCSPTFARGFPPTQTPAVFVGGAAPDPLGMSASEIGSDAPGGTACDGADGERSRGYGPGKLQESDPMTLSTTVAPAPDTGSNPGATRSEFRVTREKALTWYRQMLLIRRFEERSAMLYQNQRIGGFCHLYSGQEPVAVGSIGAVRDEDYLITAYRDHGHALARGMSARSAMAELLGKVTGCSKGKGGSMHFFDAGRRFLGGHAIVGSHIALATGVGFASKYQKDGSVCLCYFGDGAINQGTFHESMNMAAMWKLPVIYICENNRYAMGTSLQRSSAVLDLTVRGGSAYGIPGIFVNGNDIEAMALVTHQAAERARAGEGPTFIDAHTYRLRGHSMSDPGKYRTKEELDRAKENDPVLSYGVLLTERGWIDEPMIEQLHEEVKQEVEDAIEFAEQSADAPFSSLYEDVTVTPFIPQE